MCITEYNEEKTMAWLKEEALEEGRKEGMIKTLIDLVNTGVLDLKIAAAKANMSISEFQAKAAAYT